jgi:hypothetical protein
MAVVGLFVMVLSGCFGANPLLTTMEPPPTFETARSELRAISAAANSLLVSDLVVSLSGSDRANWRRAPTSCGRTRCLATLYGYPFLRIRLADDSSADDVGFVGDPELVYPLERDRGVTLGGFRRKHEQRSQFGHVDTNVLSLDGWMQYSTFSLDYSVIQFGLFDDGTDLRNVQYYFGSSTGMATNTNPVSGSATWRGLMVGGQVGPDSAVGDVVRGDATLVFDFTNVDMDVFFTNIRDLNNREASPVYPNMTWQNLPVSNGRFGENLADPSIEGRFYGPNHEEVGGIFERNQIIGAFGATR